MADKFDDLERLGKLLDEGKVDSEEYALLKSELLSKPEQPTAPEKAPGWYNDPAGNANHQAYWDGQKWTGSTRPRPTTKVTSSSGLDPVLKSKWFWLAVGVTILIVLSQCGGGSSSPGNSPAAPDVGDQVGAYVVCQQFVEDRLVAPATAEFGGPYSQVTKTLGGGRYEVDTYVDSQNGFGALVRSDFVCTVKHVAGDRYSLESLDISE